ncbi:hypothetical protein [Streptomyces sp. KR55]|uniref:hypothetical protein n=1 Tax=Streptomyces sp. KR55 TaxID=3457425 RepID=UPI003FD13EE5
MNAAMFVSEMEAPIHVEVAVSDQRAEFEEGFGSGEAPAGAGDVEPVGDQVSAGPFDHSRRDRPAGGERTVVMEEGFLTGQVADADVGAVTPSRSQPRDAGLPVDRLGGQAGTSGEHGQGLDRNPVLGGRIAGIVERPRGLPEVLEDVDEVDDDVDGDAPQGGLGLDEVELVPGGVALLQGSAELAER